MTSAELRQRIRDLVGDDALVDRLLAVHADLAAAFELSLEDAVATLVADLERLLEGRS